MLAAMMHQRLTLAWAAADPKKRGARPAAPVTPWTAGGEDAPSSDAIRSALDRMNARMEGVVDGD